MQGEDATMMDGGKGGLELVPLHGDFGVEARGVDISRPLDAATVSALRDAFGQDTFSVRVLR